MSFQEPSPQFVLDDPWLSPAHIAQQIGVSDLTVLRNIRSKRLRAIRVGGGRLYRSRQSWVDAWLGGGDAQ